MSSQLQPADSLSTSLSNGPDSSRHPPARVEWLQSVELGYALDGEEHDRHSRPPADGAYRCFNCGATHGTMLKCGRCRVACYCQRECQVNDWKVGGHRRACDSYRRVGPEMGSIPGEADRDEARTEIFYRIRYYACPYAVHKFRELGKGFLFVQGNCTLAVGSLVGTPKDRYGRVIDDPPRSLLLHYLTIGEYDAEVCKDDFEMMVVRNQLREAVLEKYDEYTQVVVLMKFRCGSLALGIAEIAPGFAACQKLGLEYFAGSTAGALQLNLDDDKY